MTQASYELDVRPILRSGGEPFSAIMQAVNGLSAGQALRLLATFEPVPLYTVLGKKGFDHAAREIGEGDWEVLFTPQAQAANAQPTHDGAAASAWPEPVHQLDNRDLEPPEPMVRTLAAVEELRPGEVLCALLCREPVLLLPELGKRGLEWLGAFEADGTMYKLLIRRAAEREAAK
ncbi:DUF2249 domain-containing protein [Bradyrhizobium cenepequi]|uniref:DUF2249 domain-containing protein n=1 Tax=Bradyrhizobium cenepequi TaxID=2821403 RepID=UPI001CE240F4|nr:DUF2249 domain-containing protein [Bradyrhizobium cenepequi]MCA6111726.1 DUF2249 domain-containing protein [Bradyrhizobium cenepequi]